MNTSDLELLARYSRQGAEDAFAEVVRRHAGMVYSVALRVTRTPQLAEDVAQAVFLELARYSKKLRPDTVLAAWLYSVTRRIAANTVRGETRRLIREHAAYAMNAALMSFKGAIALVPWPGFLVLLRSHHIPVTADPRSRPRSGPRIRRGCPSHVVPAA